MNDRVNCFILQRVYTQSRTNCAVATNEATAYITQREILELRCSACSFAVSASSIAPCLSFSLLSLSAAAVLFGVGLLEGAAVGGGGLGDSVGENDGAVDGVWVGAVEGLYEGDFEGLRVGPGVVGACVGLRVGEGVGPYVGEFEGETEGEMLGRDVGLAVGD